MILATKLKVVLVEMNVKQSSLAEKIGINPTTLNMIVNGKSVPNLLTAQKIAYALETTVDYLWPYKPEEEEE